MNFILKNKIKSKKIPYKAICEITGLTYNTVLRKLGGFAPMDFETERKIINAVREIESKKIKKPKCILDSEEFSKQLPTSWNCNGIFKDDKINLIEWLRANRDKII